LSTGPPAGLLCTVFRRKQIIKAKGICKQNFKRKKSISVNITSEDLSFPFHHVLARLQLTLKSRAARAESQYMKNTFSSTAFQVILHIQWVPRRKKKEKTHQGP